MCFLIFMFSMLVVFRLRNNLTGPGVVLNSTHSHWTRVTHGRLTFVSSLVTELCCSRPISIMLLLHAFCDVSRINMQIKTRSCACTMVCESDATDLRRMRWYNESLTATLRRSNEGRAPLSFQQLTRMSSYR